MGGSSGHDWKNRLNLDEREFQCRNGKEIRLVYNVKGCLSPEWTWELQRFWNDKKNKKL